MFDSLLAEYQSRSWLSSDEIRYVKGSNDPKGCVSKMLRDRMIETDGLDPDILKAASYLGSILFNSWTQEARMAHKSTLRLSSFSEIRSSIIMWRHYAGQHSGFCLEYDLETLTTDDATRRFLFPAIYSTELFDATPYSECSGQH